VWTAPSDDHPDDHPDGYRTGGRDGDRAAPSGRCRTARPASPEEPRIGHCKCASLRRTGYPDTVAGDGPAVLAGDSEIADQKATGPLALAPR